MSDLRKIVAIVGLEQYNAGLWKKIKGLLASEAELIQLSDIDLEKTASRCCQGNSGG